VQAATHSAAAEIAQTLQPMTTLPLARTSL
jgi:hypothetical protein